MPRGSQKSVCIRIPRRALLVHKLLSSGEFQIHKSGVGLRICIDEQVPKGCLCF